MQLQEEIKQWFHNDRNYNSGVALYFRATTNKKLFAFFSKPQNQNRYDRLLWELCSIANLPVNAYYHNVNNLNKQTPEPANKTTKKSINNNTDFIDFKYAIKYKDLPPELQKLVIEKGQLYKHAISLKLEFRNNISLNNEPQNIDKRKIVYSELRNIYNKIINTHSILIEYTNTGKLPSDNNTQPQISKLSNEFDSYAHDLFRLKYDLKNAKLQYKRNLINSTLATNKYKKQVKSKLLADNWAEKIKILETLIAKHEHSKHN